MLHKLHRMSAGVIAVFALCHLANHLMAVSSIAAHIAVMDAFRLVYRLPLVETLLLACVAFQAGSGCYFIVKRWGQRRALLDKLQALSGAYLVFFLLVHAGAVVRGRMLNLDTNFYYAAAGLNIRPANFFFMPYYFLAVLALAVHVACALHWLTRHAALPGKRTVLACSVMGAGALSGALIVASFSGAFYEVVIPPAFLAQFR